MIIKRWVGSLFYYFAKDILKKAIHYPVNDKNLIWFGENAFSQLKAFIANGDFSSIFFVVDENTNDLCLPYLLQSLGELPRCEVLEVEAGEDTKSPEVLVQLWMVMSELQADRHSLVINLGGGVITDLGGFLAGTYMRGVPFINIPTSLLAMVDASNGGKNGINLGHYKNRIGLFLNPEAVCVVPDFLETLPEKELRSGFAEMLKHGLISDTHYWKQLVEFHIDEDVPGEEMIRKSIEIKQAVIDQDFKEAGPRKVLNFGHTIGHAIESLSLQTENPLLHGEAIALGMIAETYVSEKYAALSDAEAQEIRSVIQEVYHDVTFLAEAEDLLELIQGDKKNRGDEVRLTLITRIGNGVVDVPVSREDIIEAMSMTNILA